MLDSPVTHSKFSSDTGIARRLGCRAEIDRPIPLYAVHGLLELSGWCFLESYSLPAHARLVVFDRVYNGESALLRRDVAAAFPDFPQARFSGFHLRTWLPPGYGEAHLEISRDGTEWIRVKSLVFCAEQSFLLGTIEMPSGYAIAYSSKVQGWACHPQERLKALFLHVGNSMIKCDCMAWDARSVMPIPDIPRDQVVRFSCATHLRSGINVVQLVALLHSGATAVTEHSQRLLAKSAPAVAFIEASDKRRASEISFESTDAPEVSLVIPALNYLGLTLACLQSVRKHTCSRAYEVIVVSDGSNQHTRSCLDAIQGLRIIHSGFTRGFVYSCNAGAERAKGKYLLFLNNDTEVTPNWLDALLRVFEQRADAGLVGAKLVYGDGRLQEAGAMLWRDATSHRYGIDDDARKPEYNYLREVDYCSAACVLLPKGLFTKLGGFDPVFAPGYYEDVDLAFKVRRFGQKTYYQPSSVVVHHERQTSGPNTDSAIRINRRKFVLRWESELPRHLRPESSPRRAANRLGATKRALVIVREIADLQEDSGSNHSWLRHLQELGFEITLFSPNLAEASPELQKRQEMGVECLYPPFVNDLESLFEKRAREFAVVMLCGQETTRTLLPLCHKYFPTWRIASESACPNSQKAEYGLDWHQRRNAAGL
jgi:GT2 family glycosyltransferase